MKIPLANISPPAPAEASELATSARRFDLDWIRIIAFGLLIFYHIGMFYVTWDWLVKSPHASEFLEPLMLLTNPWRLSLLFLVSGVATHFIFDRLSAGQLARSRSWRLLIPLIFGMLVIVPPQSYYQVVEKLQYGEGYLAFWMRDLKGHSTFMIDNHRLILPTWNHLWFVVYLWVYTLLIAAFLQLTPRGINRITVWLERLLVASNGYGIIVWPLLMLTICRVFLFSIFPSTMNLVHDWYNHSNYFFMFLFGFMFIRSATITSTIVRLRWLCLMLAVAAYAFLMADKYGHYFPSNEPMFYFRALVNAANRWCAILAILGFARLWLNHDSPSRRYLTDAIFPIYIVHQTAIVVYAHNLQPLQLPVAIEAVVLIAATISTCLVSYEIVRRVSWMRPLFGLKLLQRQPAKIVATSS